MLEVTSKRKMSPESRASSLESGHGKEGWCVVRGAWENLRPETLRPETCDLGPVPGAWGLGTGDWGVGTGDWGLVTGDW